MHQNKDSQSTTNGSQLTTRQSSSCTRVPQRPGVAIVWNRLSIDANDGSLAVQYRIGDGFVERRTLQLAARAPQTTDGQWQRLTPQQLTTQVLASAVVATWLCRRMGFSALIRACDQRSSFVSHAAEKGPSRHPQELVIGEFSPLLAKTSDSSTEGLFNA